MRWQLCKATLQCQQMPKTRLISTSSVSFESNKNSRVYDLDGGRKGPIDKGVLLGLDDILVDGGLALWERLSSGRGAKALVSASWYWYPRQAGSGQSLLTIISDCPIKLTVFNGAF
jgi:hypothetical protein